MADPVKTRVPLTLDEWLDYGDSVCVDDPQTSAPSTGTAAMTHLHPATLLRLAAGKLADLGARAGAPQRLVTAWTVQMHMAATRLEDAEEDATRERLRRQTRWTLRRDRLARAVAELVHDPAVRVARWASDRGAGWED
jgi:hypothetical protein